MGIIWPNIFTFFCKIIKKTFFKNLITVPLPTYSHIHNGHIDAVMTKQFKYWRNEFKNLKNHPEYP